MKLVVKIYITRFCVVKWKIEKEVVVVGFKVLADIRLERLRKTMDHFGQRSEFHRQVSKRMP
jgi:hypothetical protein